jgi:SAM-dependent methyltransferase
MPVDARVTDDHVAVPSTVVDPVVVSFDDQYVWSFSPSRDGVRSGGAWEVPWPEAVHHLLEGTTRVRLGDLGGEQVHFEGKVAFRGSAAALELRDEHGHPMAVDRAGHLMRIFAETDDSTRRFIAEGTARALHDLRERVGIDAHLSYGCLLGAVRDGKMIGHDTDADLAYLSAYDHPADVARESFRMERELRELGWKVFRMSAADLKLFLPLPDGQVVQIDVFGAFHVGGTFYQMGGRSGSLPREALTPPSTVRLEGVDLVAPADPEQVLAFLYGSGWRVPDPSFQNEDPVVGVQRLSGWFGGGRRHLARWNELFRARRPDIPRSGSTFAHWVRGRIPAGSHVVDLGSGTGRDAGFFLREGFDVSAADFSNVAMRMTRGVLVRRGIEDPDVRQLQLDDLRAVLLTGAELARLPQAPYLYARGLLGCLDRAARGNLWVLCGMTLRRGGSLHVEYAAARPGLRTKQVDGLVRRLHTSALRREVEAAGGRVVHVEQGPGRDQFGLDDPLVGRMEIRWDHHRTSSGGGAVFKDTVQETTASEERSWSDRVRSLPAVVADLRASVKENRRLNRRLAELTDIVAELLVPLADREPEKAQELLAKYRRTTLGS